MARAMATYHAPKGDLRVIEWNGVTFFDGLPTEVNSDDNEEIMRKLPRNQFFTFEMVEDGSEATHEEKSDDLKGLKVAELRELADARGIDHTDKSKAELREALRNVQNAG